LPAGTEVNTLYGPGGCLPRAKGSAVQPVQTPLHSESRLPERFGPDGPILNRMGSEKGENFWHHDRFGFQAGAIQPASDLREAECLIIPAMQWTMNIRNRSRGLPVSSMTF